MHSKEGDKAGDLHESTTHTTERVEIRSEVIRESIVDTNGSGAPAGQKTMTERETHDDKKERTDSETRITVERTQQPPSPPPAQPPLAPAPHAPPPPEQPAPPEPLAARRQPPAQPPPQAEAPPHAADARQLDERRKELASLTQRVEQLKMESAALQVHCIPNSVYFSLPPCIF